MQYFENNLTSEILTYAMLKRTEDETLYLCELIDVLVKNAPKLKRCDKATRIDAGKEIRKKVDALTMNGILEKDGKEAGVYRIPEKMIGYVESYVRRNGMGWAVIKEELGGKDSHASMGTAVIAAGMYMPDDLKKLNNVMKNPNVKSKLK
jgi:hypothetical protein